MRIALVFLAGAVLVSGCGGDQRAERGAYTAQEVRWIQHYADWTEDYQSVLDDAESAYEAVLAGQKQLGDYFAALKPVRSCLRTLREKLSPAPSERLRSFLDLLADACRAEERIARAESRRFGDSERAQVRIIRDAERESDRLFRRVDRGLERGLRVNRRLPVAGGVVNDSRIEPRLTRVARELTAKVEVRCWSPHEWAPMLAEWEAYAGKVSDVAGFISGRTRANLHPLDCANLARFAYERWRPARGDELEEASGSIELLAHETEHVVNPLGTEDETECRAMQDVPQVARALAASDRYARLLADTYWRRSYPTAPSNYRTPDCRDGGPLDMRPGSDVWP